ncbi:MAG: type IV pilus assembly protein PilM [Candidatus Magasanikbacteria bacterium]|nr:type IV pilus assembly protein PilM [Candidatus Magasanikbacteria bacterium]
MFTNPFPHAFGLDIGDLSIKLVEFRNDSFFSKGPSYKLIQMRSISLPPGLIVNGEIVQPDRVHNYIKKLVDGRNAEKKSVRSPWVVSVLPEPQGFVKLINIPKPLADIIEDDVIIEANKHIPFTESDKYYLDWQVIPEHTNDIETKILITAIPQSISDSYTSLLEGLGLGVVALETEALAICRAMVTAQKKYVSEARALLDIGSTRSSLIIYDDNTIQLSSSLSYSGELLTTALAQSLKMSHEEAEQLKKRYGLEFKNEKKIWAPLMRETAKFAEEIRKTIFFYYSHFPHTNRITHITMCGGGSTLKFLDKVLSLELKIECRTGNVWKNLSPSQETLHDESALAYATAIGLALRAADNPYINHDTI